MENGIAEAFVIRGIYLARTVWIVGEGGRRAARRSGLQTAIYSSRDVQ